MSSDEPITPPLAPPPLQFDRADYITDTKSASDCVVCKQPITDTYYEANSKVICPACMVRLSSATQAGTKPVNVLIALAAGSIAAVIGAAINYGIYVKSEGGFYGIAAILIAFMIGKAVRYGSKNFGGILYQIIAVILTYLAIAGMYFPIVLADLQKHGSSLNESLSNLVVLATVLALPIIVGFRSFITLLILCFALWQAWKTNRRLKFTFTGPFHLGNNPS